MASSHRQLRPSLITHRRERFEKRAVNGAVRRNDRAGANVHRAAVDRRERSSCGQYARRPAGEVPRAQLSLPIPVVCAVCDEAQVARGRAQPANSLGRVPLDRDKLRELQLVDRVGLAPIIRKSRREQAPSKLLLRADGDALAVARRAVADHCAPRPPEHRSAHDAHSGTLPFFDEPQRDGEDRVPVGEIRSSVQRICEERGRAGPRRAPALFGDQRKSRQLAGDALSNHRLAAPIELGHEVHRPLELDLGLSAKSTKKFGGGVLRDRLQDPLRGPSIFG